MRTVAGRLIVEVESSDHDKGLLKSLGIQDPGNWDEKQDFTVEWYVTPLSTNFDKQRADGARGRQVVHGYRNALRLVQELQQRPILQDDGNISVNMDRREEYEQGKFTNLRKVCIRFESSKNGTWERRRSSEAIYRQRWRGKREQ